MNDNGNALAPLFPEPIPIIGVTGEYASGKTLFELTIAPGPATLQFDTEKSSESYRSLGFTRVDVPAEMLRLHPAGYKPIQTFEWWRGQLRTIPAGKYRVIALDTALEIETGLVDWVRANPSYFGRTSAQYQRMSGLMWGDAKELWKAILSDLASRCECFVFSVHMGDTWSGDRPTGKRKPKGKSTLMELASLFVQLERRPDARGATPATPSAVVLKSRLAHTRVSAAGEVEILPALPPRLPVATPAAIRQYLLCPPDYQRLRPEELAPQQRLSGDERAAIRLATAEAEVETERLRAERLHATQTPRPSPLVPPPGTSPSTSTEQAAPPPPESAAQTPASEEASHPLAEPAATEPLPTEIVDRIMALCKSLRLPWGKVIVQLQEKYKVDSFAKLTRDEAAEVVEKLTQALAQNQRTAAQKQMAEA